LYCTLLYQRLSAEVSDENNNVLYYLLNSYMVGAVALNRDQSALKSFCGDAFVSVRDRRRAGCWTSGCARRSWRR
jgi:hypothetical protein